MKISRKKTTTQLDEILNGELIQFCLLSDDIAYSNETQYCF